MWPVNFKPLKELKGTLGRVGEISTPHGSINTPAFIVVGTKATVKALTPEMVKDLGAEAILCNTYHLHLEPGEKIVKEGGGLHQFMNWSGPMFTDSGGFQVFSLGAAYGEGGVTKFAKAKVEEGEDLATEEEKRLAATKLAKIDDDGVTFRSHLDGREHRFTPEISVQIQHDLGADIIFAFDECTAPGANLDYQKQALARTHAWAKRSLDFHMDSSASAKQGLFGIVQGGQSQELREESARFISGLPFAGFGIGGSFTKADLQTAVGWVNKILPNDKPRHLLGIGEPTDIFEGVEAGVDTFDCVIGTRAARNGGIYTKNGRFNVRNANYKNDFSPLESDCGCYACQNYTKAYIAHLFRSEEMLAATLASVHNLYFLVNLTKNIRQSIIDDTYFEYKAKFLSSFNLSAH